MDAARTTPSPTDTTALLAHNRAVYGDATMTMPTPPAPAPPAPLPPAGPVPQPPPAPAAPPPAAPPFQPPAVPPPGEPVRPDGVSEEEWAALGDPGRRAIERERRNAREAARRAEQAERERDEARRTTPPAPTQAPPTPASTDAPDVATLVQQAVQQAMQAALQPIAERDIQRTAQRVQERAQAIAAEVLIDPRDAGALDLSRMVTATGDPDEQAIRDGIARLVEERPHLAKPVDGRRAAPGSGQGPDNSGGLTLQQKVQQQLALMNGGVPVTPPAPAV